MDASERKPNIPAKTKMKGERGVRVRFAEEETGRKEVLKESLREKLELEKRALQVVERLLDENVTAEFLTDCVRLITPANYRDAVEERSISKVCGYPVCSNKLINVSTQQYKISTKTNKVYDITERKFFCSNFCFKASKYLEVQISKSPLWLRKEESPPDVKLMTKGDGGSSGLEVKFDNRRVSHTDVDNPIAHASGLDASSSECADDVEEQDFVSSLVSRQCSGPRVHWGNLPKLNNEDPMNKSDQKCDMPSNCWEQAHRDEAIPKSQLINNSQINQSAKPSVEETRNLLDQFALQHNAVSTCKEADELSDNKNTTESSLNISQVGMSRKNTAGLQNFLKNYSCSKPPVTLSLSEALRRTLMEWRTEETIRFLYGSDYTLHPKATKHSDEEEEELDEDDLENPEEIPEKMKHLGESRSTRPTATAPDYEALKKDTEILELKVQEFYRGACVLPEEVESNVVNENSIKKNSKTATSFPLVDSQAQQIIQKRIAVEKLCRSLRDVVGPLGVTMSEIINDINNLVRTFRFTNVNIIHKPSEWTVIAVVLLFALTEVSPTLKTAMVKASSLEYTSLVLKAFKLQEEDLLSLVQLLKPEQQIHSSQ